MFPFRFLAFIAALVGFAEDRGEGLGECGAAPFVVGDVHARVAGLVRDPPFGVARVRLGVVCIGQQPQRVMEERPPARAMLAVLDGAAVHVGQARTDAVLVALQCVEVDGVGEVRGEQVQAVFLAARPRKTSVVTSDLGRYG